MSLVIDNRGAIGAEPGTHALIIGVSEYLHLIGGSATVDEPWGMQQLTSTATSANLIAEWLKTAKLSVPLATIRLLLAPSPNETALAGVAASATLANVLAEAAAWRTDASTHRDNVTFFYFAGHGVQRTKDDAVLCLHDFRAPGGSALRCAVDVATIRAGMSPSPKRSEIARTQFYFADACRVQPEEFKNFEPMETTAVFNRDLGGEDNRSAPIFYSSISNKASLALPGKQTLFSTVVLECLNGAAGDSLELEANEVNANDEPRWAVTVSGLNRGIDLRLDELNRRLGADQTYAPGGQFKQATICLLPGPPMVDVRLSVDPEDACAVARLEMLDGNDTPKVSRIGPLSHPIEERLPAGLYTVRMTFNPPVSPFINKTRLQPARAPRSDWKIKVV